MGIGFYSTMTEDTFNDNDGRRDQVKTFVSTLRWPRAPTTRRLHCSEEGSDEKVTTARKMDADEKIGTFAAIERKSSQEMTARFRPG